MNLLVLSSFIVGPVMVAYYLIKREIKAEKEVKVFDSRWPRSRF